MNLAYETLFKFLESRPELIGATPQTRITLPRAEYHPGLISLKSSELQLHQTFRPDVRLLEAQGFKPTQMLDQECDVVLFVPTRQKRESLNLLAKAFSLLKPGGLFIGCGENSLGAKSYRSHLFELAGEEGDSFPLNRCTVFWLKKGGNVNQEKVAEWLKEGESRLVEGTDFHTHVGIFGWNKVDLGSKLLEETLPTSLHGIGADFGAGYGYLSYHMLKKCQKIEELHVIEAESVALDDAKKNIAALNSPIKVNYLWQDLTKEFQLRNLDFIVTNPPCHEAGKQSPEAGMEFIRAAHRALRPQGILYLVANVTLPYEKFIRELFPQELHNLVRRDGFKVISVRK